MFRSLMVLMTLVVTVLATPTQALTLKIATIAPDGTNWMKEMRWGAEEIKRRTQGRVKLRFFPGGVMGNDESVLRKIRIGQLHGGALTGGGLMSIYPDSFIYNLPLSFDSYDQVDYVRERMDALLLDGLEQRGFVSFGIGEGGFAYIMSDRPLRTVDDMQGQKVWVPEGDRVSRAGFEAIGVSPIPLPLVDVLTGLQTGLIDTVASSPSGAIALQWHTRIKYVTEMPVMYLYGTFIVKKKTFEKLKLEDQSVVKDVMELVFEKLNRQNRLDNQSAREALKQQGITFVQSSEEDHNRWYRLVAKEMDRLAREGVFSPAMLKTLRDHLNDYQATLDAPN